jgi:glyoxylase-like metal-dependent hydrolase (beta-lactamase superfamily II)
MRISEFDVSPIIDVVGRRKPTGLYVGTTDAEWAPHRGLLDADGMLESAIGGFLILGCGDRVILVDAGLGGHPSAGPFAGLPPERSLLANLSERGVGPDDVTDVVFTHLHADHTGWATKRGEVIFGSATYWCDESDWAHFIGPDPGTTRKLRPISSRLRTWDSGQTLFPGFDVVQAPGHTPGSAIIVLSAGSERAMLLGDVVHCAVELLDSEWEGIGDVDPVLAQRTKENLAREIEGTEVKVAAAHFPGLRFGRLLYAEGRRSWMFDAA